MSLPRSDSAESICTVLTCSSEEYQDFFSNETLQTEVLSEDALNNIIRPNKEKLRLADKKLQLDKLLSAMLEEAPHPLGQRYVAVCLHIAHQKGEDGVINAAKAWVDNLLLPMLAISKTKKTEPASSQTSTIDTTGQFKESASRNDPPALRAKVALREQFRCSITKWFDFARAEKLSKEGRFDEIPDVGQQPMEAAHIIPFLLDNFDGSLLAQRSQTDAARTWDMLQSWTQIDFKTLVGPNINSPTNAIYMVRHEHSMFGSFKFYLDKEAYPDIPNKYKVRMAREGIRLSNGLREVDVEFRTQEESSIEPPNPQYLKVHAAFAKVLHISGAAEYVESIERDAEMEGTLRLNCETDFGSYLRSKFVVLAY